jgi:hypothetical protein
VKMISRNFPVAVLSLFHFLGTLLAPLHTRFFKSTKK